MTTLQAPALKTAQAGKYLAFGLGAHEYAVEILRVQQIHGLPGLTRAPEADARMRGVLALRGRKVPVVDLRRACGLPAVPDTEKTCVIVVEATAEGRQAPLGLVVDEVTEVVTVAQDAIAPAGSAAGAGLPAQAILAKGRVGGRDIHLVDIDEILAGGDGAERR